MRENCTIFLGLYTAADPGFPQGGRQLPGGGRQHTILPNFPKNCMKSKEFGHPGGGRVPLAPPPPLNPPLVQIVWTELYSIS